MTRRLDPGGVNYHHRSIPDARAITPIAKRVVLAVIDGLRPEAIDEFGLSNIKAIADLGASTLTGQSVSPTYATTCVASLMTGVSPSDHGMQTDRLSFPRHLGRLETLPRVIAGEGFQTSAFMGEVPSTIRGTAGLIGRELGFQSLSFSGNTSAEILRSAVHALCSQRRGLIALHFGDVDCAGHEHGWMSYSYGAAARRVDQSIGILNALSAPGGGESLLVVLGHHTCDLTIPIVIAGRQIARSTLGAVSLLDIAPTILWALGISVPRNYQGRVLNEAFDIVTKRSAVFA